MDRLLDVQTDGHCNSMTYPDQRAKSIYVFFWVDTNKLQITNISMKKGTL